MAHAEQAAVTRYLKVDLCPTAACTCKPHNAYFPDMVRVGQVIVGEEGMTTPLFFSEHHLTGERLMEVPGVHLTEDVKAAINACEGPVELSSGEIACGAISLLQTRKTQVNGR